MTAESRPPAAAPPPAPRDRATDLPGELGRHGIVIAVVAFFAGYVVSGIVASVYAAATGAAVDSYGVQIAGLLGLWVGTLGVPVYASHRWGTGDLGRDYGLAIDWATDLATGVVAGLVGQFLLVTGIVEAFKLFQHDLKLNEASVELAQQSRGAQFVLFAVLVVVGAPIVEELFFRGLLLRALDRRMPTWAAVAVSSALFGLAHISGGTVAGALALALALTAFACVLAVLAVRTGRLGAAIVAHMVFNAIATAQIYAQSGRGH